MIPSQFHPLASFPLSPNGKVDRSALKPLDAIAEVVAAPIPKVVATEIEQTIAELWRRALNVDRIELDDNFFDLGGNSLALVEIHAALKNALQVDIPLVELFEFTTIRALARRLRGEKELQPTFSGVQQRGQKQRAAFARRRERLGQGSGT